MILTIGLNGTFVDNKIPIGNIYHPNGDWRAIYNEQDVLRHSFLEKIYKKIDKFFTMQEIVSNFEVSWDEAGASFTTKVLTAFERDEAVSIS